MKTLLEWLEENRSTLKDGVYEVTGLGNIFCNNKSIILDAVDVSFTRDKYNVKDGVITLYNPKPVRSLDQWLKDGVYTYDTGVVYCDGEVFAHPVHLNPTLDEYRVVDGVVILSTQPVSDPVNKYNRQCKGVTIDVYDVLKAFEVTDPALQHLIKKALCTGLRGHKSREQDLQDILDSAKRAVELNK